tara:strand:+ start:201 stop:587 length:387 start_codon:yes stop_codon:yes gene_type:complete
MSVELKDWLNSINHTKENIIDIDPDLEKDYPPYIINKCLSGFVDTILFSNEMNMFSHLDKKMQYDFYINIVRKRKRFSPWLRKEKIDDLEHIKRYYGYSNEKAQIALTLLTKEQIEFIRSKNDMGGKG